MKAQKCCVHCPGIVVPPGSNESHECCQPKYVSGNMRISSLTKHVPECPERRSVKEDSPEPLPESRTSCYDQFAFAKRLHAENLEHQPLPDKVDDSVFKIPTSGGSCRRVSSGGRCDCCDKKSKDRANGRYGPTLGCKEPKTKMDLAICWETPVDPVYEPPRPAHIDGSEGGPAPAIFTRVERAPNSATSLRSGVAKNGERCQSRCKTRRKSDRLENRDADRKVCCCDCLSRDLKNVRIANDDRIEKRPKRTSFRRCMACEPRSFEDDPRLIKSAVGLALGLEKGQNDQRRNDSKTTVPRPKTPFARRSFRIDSLSPPFSVVNGSRSDDYPEHWRLMSVYQQSYKNPYRRRTSYR
ncbi:uncharacterized protein LOC122404346 [Colletes gigas]|uniref:uncharacterized protein LOC122404346 n=1 Tax=Colletes gigas TaxID=935657 RepID=UPI001C9ADF0D|nr:uncharacterized protein LOC122404346 [Colletes gigas]